MFSDNVIISFMTLIFPSYNNLVYYSVEIIYCWIYSNPFKGVDVIDPKMRLRNLEWKSRRRCENAMDSHGIPTGDGLESSENLISNGTVREKRWGIERYLT